MHTTCVHVFVCVCIGTVILSVTPSITQLPGKIRTYLSLQF